MQPNMTERAVAPLPPKKMESKIPRNLKKQTNRQIETPGTNKCVSVSKVTGYKITEINCVSTINEHVQTKIKSTMPFKII